MTAQPQTFAPPSASPAAPAHRVRSEVLIARLKRLQAFEIHSTRLLGGWMAGISRWEIKHEIGLHLWQDATHSKELRTRLWELRVSNPDRGLGDGPAKVLHALAGAQADFEFLAGLYFVFKTELVAAYEAIVAGTYEVFDAPTIAAIRRILPEKRDQLAWARREVAALADSGEKQRASSRWQTYVRDVLAHVGGIAGDQPVPSGEPPVPPPGYGHTPLPFMQARRDERFKLSLTGMPLPPEDDRDGNVLFQFFNYTQEMQAAETLASTLWEAEGLEWEFYYDIARHCYDEERHSALGEARLRDLGHHVSDFPNSVANYAWRQLMDPLRRYCVLTYVIEADSFKYKHATYQKHLQAGDTESAEAVLFDIMDETLHVRLGQKWTAVLMKHYRYPGTLDELVAECRGSLMANSVNPLQKRSAVEAGKPMA